MKLYYIRQKDSRAFLEWKRVVSHWVFSREEASHYYHKESAEIALEDLADESEDDPDQLEIEEIDVDAGQEALKIVAEIARLYKSFDISGSGANGTAWVVVCAEAERLIGKLTEKPA